LAIIHSGTGRIIIITNQYMDGKGDAVSYINKLYDNLSFFEMHFQSVLIILLVTIIVIFVLFASRIKSQSNLLKNNWEAERCKPHIMPFAGIINPSAGKKMIEYTLSNFNYCVSKALSISFPTATASYDLDGSLDSVLSRADGVELTGIDVTTFSSMIEELKQSARDAMNRVKNKVANSTVPLQQTIYTIQDMFARLQAIFMAGIYTSLGNSLILKSLMSQFLESISKIFYLLLVVITALYIIPGTQGLAIATTVVTMPLLVATASINLTMGRAYGLNPAKLPTIPKCFDKNTLLKMDNGEHKLLKDIQIGDVLVDSNIVTSTIKLDSKFVRMYNVNGIIVSEFHKVKYGNDWVPISKYPHRTPVEMYAEPYIYCLNTTNKIIKINGLEFLDWDEVYHSHLLKVLNYKNVQTKPNIHALLDGGFCGDTMIRLYSKQLVCLKDIQPGDKLINGAVVYGTVQIKGDNVSNFAEYSLGQRNVFKGGPNLIFYDSYGKLHTTMDVDDILKNPDHSISYLKKPNVLYHLLTDKETFYVGNIQFKDYNSLIDTILSNIIC
jgi:hypothetical protein